MDNYFVLGDHNSICDVCGFKYKGSQLRKRWDGAMCCSDDWEARHPRDNPRIKPEKNNIKDARPEQEPRYLSTNEIQPEDL